MELQSGWQLPLQQNVSDCGRVVVYCSSGQGRLCKGSVKGASCGLINPNESAESAPQIWKWVADQQCGPSGVPRRYITPGLHLRNHLEDAKNIVAILDPIYSRASIDMIAKN
jgi:hypothetical protein